MRIIDYQYITGTTLRDNIVTIPQLKRDKLAARQFIELTHFDIELTRNTAFLYLGGTTVDQSEAGMGTGNGVYFPAIKSGTSFCAHQWISKFMNKEHLVHMEVIEGTCAAGINALKRAQELLYSIGIDEVIIIGHERITQEVVRSFKELGMPITCGDGFVYMRLEQGYDISDIKWRWAYNPNPFVFTREDIDTLLPPYRIGYVKLHGTGTEHNTDAEAGLTEAATPLTYKEEIGHTQGISALLETCIVLDDPNVRGRILVTANGFGGYYGAFTLTKPHARS